MIKTIITGTILATITSCANAFTYEWGNNICFNYTIESYTLLGYSVTPGQPFNPKLKLDHSNYFPDNNCLVISSGRELSNTPKQWVESGMENAKITWSSKSMFDTYPESAPPEELNFAVKLNILFSDNGFKFVCENLYIGQGHISDRDNWWLFSNNKHQNQTISCAPYGSTEPFLLSITNSDGLNTYINTFFLN